MSDTQEKETLTAEERAWLEVETGAEARYDFPRKLLRLYDAALARAEAEKRESAGRKDERDIHYRLRQSAESRLAAVERNHALWVLDAKRLAEATALLERLNTWNETEGSTDNLVSICRDTGAFLSGYTPAPAVESEPSQDQIFRINHNLMLESAALESRIAELEAERDRQRGAAEQYLERLNVSEQALCDQRTLSQNIGNRLDALFHSAHDACKVWEKTPSASLHDIRTAMRELRSQLNAPNGWKGDLATARTRIAQAVAVLERDDVSFLAQIRHALAILKGTRT